LISSDAQRRSFRYSGVFKFVVIVAVGRFAVRADAVPSPSLSMQSFALFITVTFTSALVALAYPSLTESAKV
jgi:hypothetical protein